MFSVVCVVLAVSQFAWQETFATGKDYPLIAHHLQASRQPADAFLVQPIDQWQDENHFDRIWLERYTDRELPIVNGPHRKRARLVAGGLPLEHVSSDVQRVWVYSHLFKEKWLARQHVKGWRLSELRSFGGPFPLALFERESELRQNANVALNQLHGI